ncbi:hypothetical protein [Leucobacter sp. NPDC077196]|uniref:hypothetical protein n=1 Tax=Leucobacter sp. NPDC077196 TaxID=3154959 RepID=UPI0034497204
MILGIDFSLTATGVCAISEGEAECFTVVSKPEPYWWLFPERVEEIADRIMNWANAGGFSPTVVVESPAYMSKGSGLDRMFGGWWLLIDKLQTAHDVEPPILKVAPAQLKKFVTGKGNAGKDEMNFAIARRYPDVDVTNNNEGDALGLATIGAAVMGEPFTGVLTKYQQEIVDAVRAGGKDKK